MTNTVQVAPSGFWLKTHFYRDGHMLHAVTYSCVGGSPEIFKASVDLRPILNKVVSLHTKLHGGKAVSGDDILVGFSFNPFKAISSIAKSASNLVNKIGKSKLISQIASTAKSVVTSKITGAIVTTMSVAFPIVGVPALAAYAGANNAIKSIDQAQAAVKMAKDVVNKALPEKVRSGIKSELNKWAGATVKDAIANKIQIPHGYQSTLAQAMKITKDRADKSKAAIAHVAARAKQGDVEAQKMSRIINLAHSARQQLKHIAGSSASPSHSKHGHHQRKHHLAKVKHRGPAHLNGFPAVLVTNKGQIIPGHYLEKKGAPVATVLRGGKVYRGSFAAVGGVFGCEPAVGCCNPTSKPPALR